MIQALLGTEDIPDDLLNTLWVYSKGIPLHVEDYLAVLLERGSELLVVIWAGALMV